MDQVKYSFLKVKRDMEYLQQDLNIINSNLEYSQQKISFLEESLNNLTQKVDSLIPLLQELIPTHNPKTSTIQQYIPAHNLPLKAQKAENLTFSTGNEGVPADRQTNQQTNQHTKNPFIPSSFNNSIEILSSLDDLKKEIKYKFKNITEQEFLVFSTIYQLSEQEGYTDYKSLSSKLNLTQSSIRDYVGKLIKKEIPIQKIKLNNKIIQLKIKDNFKKIAPLPILIQLREI